MPREAASSWEITPNIFSVQERVVKKLRIYQDAEFVGNTAVVGPWLVLCPPLILTGSSLSRVNSHHKSLLSECFLWLLAYSFKIWDLGWPSGSGHFGPCRAQDLHIPSPEFHFSITRMTFPLINNTPTPTPPNPRCSCGSIALSPSRQVNLQCAKKKVQHIS